MKLHDHAGDVHDTKTTKLSLIKTNCKQGMRNIFHVLVIVAFLDLVYVYLIKTFALVAKVVIFFLFEKQLPSLIASVKTVHQLLLYL